MKRLLVYLFIVPCLLLSINAYAGSKFSAKVGDIVENEVGFGKDKFPLPSGKFTVAVSKKWQDFRDVLLVQIDEDTGIVKWKIHLTATGYTKEKNSAWLPSKMCDQTNVYFIKVEKGSARFACWIVSHSDAGAKDIIRLSKSNNFFSFGNTMYHKIGAHQGYSVKVEEYESASNINSPDMFIVSRHHYANKSKLYESEYYYNPEFDGVPKSENLDWDKNEFNKNKIKNFPKHEESLKNFIGISANLINRFNKLNKVKGGFRLDAEEYFTQASLNVEKKEPKKSVKKNDIVNQIKVLKELFDVGAISQDEFDKAKKKILN